MDGQDEADDDYRFVFARLIGLTGVDDALIASSPRVGRPQLQLCSSEFWPRTWVVFSLLKENRDYQPLNQTPL